MSTLATAELSSDDSDVDFVPSLATKSKSKSKRKTKTQTKPTKEAKRPRVESRGGGEGEESSASSSDVSSDTDSDDGDEDRSKEEAEEGRKRIEEERRQRAKDEFERMRTEASASVTATAAPDTTVALAAGDDVSTARAKEHVPVEMVEIRRARRFAGETIYETIKLKADDPEAIAYLKQTQAPTDIKEDVVPIPSNEKLAAAAPTPAASSTSTSTSISTSASTSATATTTAIPKKGPIRRKPRQSLETMSAALDKGKKMTTLEKSAMDWKNHTASTVGMEDELVAHRRTGGYLDKKDFLDRVEERRNGGAGASTGRR